MAIKKRGNPNWKKGGKSPNPAGRPKDGESWAAIIAAAGNMNPEDITKIVGGNNDLGRAYLQMPKGVQMKYLVTFRVFAALMFEPTHGLWKELTERAEGKVTEHVDITSKDEKVGSDDVRAEILSKLDSIAAARDTGEANSGTDK